ncbi:hypothetical protein NQ317_018977 [Molorchus minor]|uniref:Uncharacterized protein n=1 Tax=Molorchus minor TaxID=1323400 RepID=A0ABQ9IXL7_9CUCU|nr:hypothetical protein NQ317_018977 [Molorchus minor]
MVQLDHLQAKLWCSLIQPLPCQITTKWTQKCLEPGDETTRSRKPGANWKVESPKHRKKREKKPEGGGWLCKWPSSNIWETSFSLTVTDSSPKNPLSESVFQQHQRWKTKLNFHHTDPKRKEWRAQSGSYDGKNSRLERLDTRYQ